MSDERARGGRLGPRALAPASTPRGPVRRAAAWFRRASDRMLGSDVLWGAVLVGCTVLVLGGRACGVRYDRVVAGQVASADIRALSDTDVEDSILTSKRRDEARAMVPETYVHDAGRASRLAEDLLAELRRRGDVPEPIAETLAAVLRERAGGLVVANKAVLERQPEILLLHLPSGREERLSDYRGVMDLDEVREQTRRQVAGLAGLDPALAPKLADLVASFADVNTTFDPEGTAARRDAAAAAVPAVRVRVPRGSILVRAGDVVTAETAAQVESVRRQGGGAGALRLVGLTTVAMLLAFFLWRYARHHQRYFRRVRHLHALLVINLVVSVFVAQGILWLAQEVTDGLSSPFNASDAYAFLVPVGGGAILVALLANGRIAMVFAAFAAVLFGAMTGWDAHLLLWALLAQWSAIYAIRAYRERAALLRAGLVAGGGAAAVALAVQVLRRPLQPWPETVYAAVLALLGGALGVGLLVSFALPLFEGLFKVLTDVRLLELSNLNHPLLVQLALKAPGTYNHSLTVGTLAEEAAKGIGANSLFCRVAAFYHDVGKVRKPEYYVENQRGANPHDRLAPSMSALIIAAHVKDGIRMAREAGIPEQIVDIIPQHHGTRLMGYFFEKARRTADPSLGEINEGDFRYPGPKPQTREAAIFMLCDGIEAAARTLEDPTPSRLRELIRKVANALVLDGQFDQCDLTFADLEKIEEALLRTLVGMYHHRVDYPGFEIGRPRGDGRGGGGEIRAFRGA